MKIGCFKARLNIIALAEFGRRRAKVNRSPGVSCRHRALVDDAASFPLDLPATTLTTRRWLWSYELPGIAGYFSRSQPAHPTYLTSR